MGKKEGVLKKVICMNMIRREFIRTVGIVLLLVTLSGCSVLEEPKRNENRNFSSKFSDEIGVHISLGVTSDDIKLMKEAGVKRARVDLRWSLIEKEKGKYDFVGSGYDKLNRLLINNGIHPFYILDYNNNLYEKDVSIVTEKGRKAFANFVSVATKRYSGQGTIWEIWNEPNAPRFWRFQSSYEDYFLLVKEISPVIKRNDASGLVVAPALAHTDENSVKWLEETFKRGILKYIDAVSVHPYRSDAPESVVTDYQIIRNLIAQYELKEIPIISGEWGYSMSEVNEAKQAEYLTRIFLVNSLAKIPTSIWYDWKNDGLERNNKEHNFGIMWGNNRPKLTFTAMKTLSTTLNGYKFVRKMNYGGGKDYVLEFGDNNQRKIIVFWTTGLNHHINLRIPAAEGKVVSMLGKASNVKWKKNQLYLSLSTSPTYLVIE